MPYIPEYLREDFIPISIPGAAGELNFAITALVDKYIVERGLRYEVLNAVIGALECAKLELYRRIAAPYEDKKCAMNGEVYSPELRA